MYGPTRGAVDVAVAGYGTDALSINQENPSLHKQHIPNYYSQQSSQHNPRAPLSTIAPSQKVTHNFSRTTQSRVSDSTQMQADGNERAGPHNGSRSNGNLRRKESYDDIPENMYRPEKGDYEGWIHREKLAKIESEELQAAGINLAKARSRSRDALGERIRESSTDRLGGAGVNQKDDKKRRLSPPTSQEEEERSNWDFRTPEEIAADQAAAQMYASPVLRKSGSKIPILTSSPTPIPSERYERETPMPRKRTLSGSLTPEDTLSVTKTRSGGVDGETTGSQSGSPSKSRSKSTTVSRPGTSSGIKSIPANRKVSAPTKTTALNDGRPSTRGNDMERPRTAVNRPEGDPPWLATMFKPDPRLPPDQQLIPTLAKQQMQEQWALNGQIPKVYDRDFNPLAVHDDNKYSPPIGQAEPQLNEKIESSDSRSLNPPLQSSDKIPPTTQVRSHIMATTANGTGGYSTMPKVVSPPTSFSGGPTTNIHLPPASISNEKERLPSKSSSSDPTGAVDPRRHPSYNNDNKFTPAIASPPAATSTTRFHQNQRDRDRNRIPHASEEEDEKAQKKGCCCIVM